jgi:peroxiredoxin
VSQVQSLPFESAQQLVRSFIAIYASVSAAFFVVLFFTGVHLSHQIVGPVRAFENFLSDSINGKRRQFRLRQNDELKQLEGIADRFLSSFNDGVGIVSTPLVPGEVAPEVNGLLSNGSLFDPAQILGRKAWIIFYRYATCPLCALHLDGLKEVISRAQERGVFVIAVYESSPEEFENSRCGATSEMLRAAGIPMIADRERKLYRAFKTRQDSLAAFTPKTALTLIRAFFKNFRQDSIDGKFGQLPSHFLIDESGVIVEAFYGKTFTDHINLEVIERFVA